MTCRRILHFRNSVLKFFHRPASGSQLEPSAQDIQISLFQYLCPQLVGYIAYIIQELQNIPGLSYDISLIPHKLVLRPSVSFGLLAQLKVIAELLPQLNSVNLRNPLLLL